MGFLGQDPETKDVNDTTVTNFSVATTERWMDKKGEKQSATTWHRCVAWGKQGETIAKWFSKGKPIHVTGSIQKRDYDDKEGVKKQAVDVRVTSFCFVPQSKDQSNNQAYERPEGAENHAPTLDSDESLPF